MPMLNNDEIEGHVKFLVRQYVKDQRIKTTDSELATMNSCVALVVNFLQNINDIANRTI